jgi:hypothetical protein
MRAAETGNETHDGRTLLLYRVKGKRPTLGFLLCIFLLALGVGFVLWRARLDAQEMLVLWELAPRGLSFSEVDCTKCQKWNALQSIELGCVHTIAEHR